MTDTMTSSFSQLARRYFFLGALLRLDEVFRLLLREAGGDGDRDGDLVGDLVGDRE